MMGTMRSMRSTNGDNSGPTEELGPYLVFEELAGTSLATAHRAVERFGARPPISLRRLRPRFAAEPEVVSAFEREARLAGQLRHARIIETYAYGRIDRTYYVTAELVQGPTLAQIMTHSQTASGAIPLPIVIEILIELCDALDYLHTRSDRIVHGNVTPTAVVVSAAGCVKLTDFSLARTSIAGTPDEVDPRADLYSVGVIAHQLLSGRPFASASRMQPPSRWSPQISRDLDDIVLTALHQDRSLRWQNAAAMRFALRAVAAKVGVVGGRQIHQWAVWAFSREPRQDTAKIRRMVDALERDLLALT